MTTTRHDSLEAAFNHTMTRPNLIVHSYGPDFYAVAFESLEWAERAGMKMVHDFSDLGATRPYHDSPDYR
jgi:hypothetical protein